ncbi:Disease resistance protein [Quillaja saponaria]|uniref:Disease resistance protein n=1 Tax=Quillaja saponaria TaxID=32244 RepID=A0AAD7QAQ3_QUISA|nr:Disease resistance protein [Quillaja saponaria]
MAFIGTAAAQVGLAIVGKITEFTVEPIGRQLGYICFYKKYIDELNVKINERILPTRDTVQASIRVAERNREDIAADVRQWLSDADKILEKKKELEGDKGDANAGCCTKWSCLNLWSQHQLGRKAQKLMREIDDLYRKRKTITTISHPKDPQQLISSFPTGYLSYNSRETKLKEIMDALTSTDVNVIGVHGFAGVGKTTLVREVAKRAKVDNLFDVVVFAEAKQNPDVKQIQKQIADMLGLKLEDENERARAARLLDRLKQEKRILVILDDLWEGIDLNILGIPLGDDQTGTKKLMAPKDNIGDKQEGWKVSKKSREEELPIGDAHKVCKILITSRDEGILSAKMGSKKNILVGT